MSTINYSKWNDINLSSENDSNSNENSYDDLSNGSLNNTCTENSYISNKPYIRKINGGSKVTIGPNGYTINSPTNETYNNKDTTNSSLFTKKDSKIYISTKQISVNFNKFEDYIKNGTFNSLQRYAFSQDKRNVTILFLLHTFSDNIRSNKSFDYICSSKCITSIVLDSSKKIKIKFDITQPTFKYITHFGPINNVVESITIPLAYPVDCKVTENLDWELLNFNIFYQNKKQNLRFISISLVKEVISTGVFLWWDRIFDNTYEHSPAIDTLHDIKERNIDDVIEFSKTFKKAEEYFKK